MPRFTVRIVHVTPKSPGVGRIKRHVTIAIDGESERAVRKEIESMPGYRVIDFLYWQR